MIKLDLREYTPSVTVVIAYYNGSKFIERAIQSVFAQSILPNEVIIVNDGSREDEGKFLNNLQNKYKFLIINQENGGQSSARNAGVQSSKSDFISFLDQDDFYCAGHIESLLSALPQKDLHFGFVYGDVCIANEDGKVYERGVTYKHGPHPKRSVVECIKKDMFILPSATLISKEAFLSVGGFDTNLMGYEDDDLFLKFFLEGLSSYWTKDLVTIWCLRKGSTTFSIKMLRSRFHFFKKLVSLFPDDLTQGRFYFADYIAPRFERLFVLEALNASIRKCAHRQEILQILKTYTCYIIKNQFMSLKKKYLIYIQMILLVKCPQILINICYSLFKTPPISNIASILMRRDKKQKNLAEALKRRKVVAIHTVSKQ